MTSEAALPAIDAQVQKGNIENEELNGKPTDILLQDQGDNLLQERALDSKGKIVLLFILFMICSDFVFLLAFEFLIFLWNFFDLF